MYLIFFMTMSINHHCCWLLILVMFTQQDSLRIKAPKNFLEWLCQRWPQAKDHVPQDKSLKGRRVSELMLELDSQAVEELIDASFSMNL